MILAIDPGTTHSGYVEIDDSQRVVASGIETNEDLIEVIVESKAEAIAIEMIASYGMPVGAEVFETCVWIGRFMQIWIYSGVRDRDPALVYRRDVKMHLCGSPRAKDPNIRQALIDLFGPQGTKANPGPTYGVKSHAWAALGVAATALKLEPKRMAA